MVGEDRSSTSLVEVAITVYIMRYTLPPDSVGWYYMHSIFCCC